MKPIPIKKTKDLEHKPAKRNQAKVVTLLKTFET